MAQDHPRVCGKNRLGKRRMTKGLGSPPRVREKRVVKSSSESYERITPACAGKTEPDTVVLASLADHPRVCGKNSSMISLSGCFSGSPPRVREKRVWKNTTVNRRRITPACAGKTRPTLTRWTGYEDHPRVCGKNVAFVTMISSSSGSPPRVREKHPRNQFRFVLLRITPACAGKTCVARFHFADLRDHPRVCGKNTKRSQ